MARGVKGTKGTDTRQLEVGQNADILADQGIDNVVVPVAGALDKDYADALAFMNEKVTIMIMETTNPNEPPIVEVGNNGKFRRFQRGVPTVTERKFVDCLIVKRTKITTPEYLNPAGERSTAIRQHSAMKYPFSVMEDKNPKGAEWLRRRMAEVV